MYANVAAAQTLTKQQAARLDRERAILALRAEGRATEPTASAHSHRGVAGITGWFNGLLSPQRLARETNA